MRESNATGTANIFIYALMGALIGLLIAVIATVIALMDAGITLSLQTFFQIQRSEPLLWIIDSSILVFALILGFIGQRENRLGVIRNQLEWAIYRRTTDLKQVNSDLEKENEERKQLEGVISRGKREWEATFDSVADLIVVVDKDGNIIRCNHATSAALQIGYREVIGKPVVDLFFGEQTGSQDQMPAQMAEMRFPRLSGWYEVTSSGLILEGDRHGTIYVLRNITDRKQASLDLQRQKQYYESLVKNSPIAIVTLDLDYRIVACNPAFEHLFGYAQIESIGHDLDSLISTNDFRQETQSINQAVREGKVTHEFTQRIRRDGSRVDVELFGVPVVVMGKQIGILMLYHDITELAQARREAEDADQAKSSFLANMSHEIRTPMNGVIGMLELALDTPLTDEQEDYLKTSLESAESLLALLNDILDLSKIEAHKLDLEMIDFNLHSTVEDVAQILAQRAQVKNLELSCFIQPDVPVYLRGDPGRLRQVLVNLVGNGIKFTDQGEVSIRADLIHEDALYALIRFEIIDTGIGISPEHHASLFQTFSQGDGSTTRRYGGTGLGLAISRQLVELMGGQIDFESEPGRGSRFWFTAVFEKQARPQQQILALATDLEDLHVLVVDDNATNRSVLTKLVAGFGCRAESAVSGPAGIDLLREALAENDPFRVLLLDMQMPDMDGQHTASQIKADLELNELKILILTSIGQRGDAARFADLGCDGYLLKPIKQRQLFEALLAVVGRTSTPSPKRRKLITRHTISEQQKERPPILLADDNAVNRKLVTTLLEKVGYKVESVSTGEQAVEAVQQKQYGLVLMDGQMPVMDGFEATMKIRQLESDVRTTPIIAMTAHAMKGDRERFLEAGMDDYIPKPLEPEVLFALIEKWIWSRQQQPEIESEPEATDQAGLPTGLAEEDSETIVPETDSDGEEKPGAEDELPAWLPEDLLSQDLHSEPDTAEVTAWIQEHIPPFSEPIQEDEEISASSEWVSLEPDQDNRVAPENFAVPNPAPTTSQKKTNQEVTIPAGDLPPVDIEAALPRFYFDRQFFIDMFELFITNMPDKVAELRALITQGNTLQLTQFANELKGSAANFSANKLRSLAFSLEQASEGNRLEEARQIIPEIETQVSVLENYLAKLRG